MHDKIVTAQRVWRRKIATLHVIDHKRFAVTRAQHFRNLNRSNILFDRSMRARLRHQDARSAGKPVKRASPGVERRKIALLTREKDRKRRQRNRLGNERRDLFKSLRVRDHKGRRRREPRKGRAQIRRLRDDANHAGLQKLAQRLNLRKNETPLRRRAIQRRYQNDD